MQLASSARIPDGFMAAMQLGGEKPHQGLPGRNPALYQGPTVCNSTTALGLRGQAELNRVGSCSTGKERDTESGNDYFGARYYASSLGRFMSPDYDADDDDLEPVPYANLEDPQSLNLYSYVGNNPLNRTDRNGHFRCICQPDPDYWKHQQEEARRQWLMLMLMAVTAYEMEKQQMLHPYSIWNKPAVTPAAAPAQSTPADPNQNKPKFEPHRGKHHQNAKGRASREPGNSEELYKKAIKSNDKPGTWWAQDSDGVLHRFSSDNAGGAHWSGSTAGENAIEPQNLPSDIKQAFGWTK
jgi:RHS repeat-associated protein